MCALRMCWRSDRPRHYAADFRPRAAIIFLSSSLGKFVTGEEWYIDGGETLHLAHDARQMIDAVKFSRREHAVVKK